jgi:hypothetical protein
MLKTLFNSQTVNFSEFSIPALKEHWAADLLVEDNQYVGAVWRNLLTEDVQDWQPLKDILESYYPNQFTYSIV